MRPLPAWRPATERDVPAIRALVRAAYRGPGGWTNEIGVVEGERIGPAELIRIVADPQQVLVVVPGPDGAPPEGCVCLSRLGTGPPRVAGLGLLAVQPVRQASGLGRALLAIGEGIVRERFSATEIEITVLSGRPSLIAWYGRRGFRPTGERRPFLGDETDRPLLPDPHFVVMRRAIADAPAGSAPPGSNGPV